MLFIKVYLQKKKISSLSYIAADTITYPPECFDLTEQKINKREKKLYGNILLKPDPSKGLKHWSQSITISIQPRPLHFFMDNIFISWRRCTVTQNFLTFGVFNFYLSTCNSITHFGSQQRRYSIICLSVPTTIASVTV